MVSVVQHNIRKQIGLPLLLYVVIYVLLALVERQTTTDYYFTFVLRMLTDHYLIIYCMTPIFLLSIFKLLEENMMLILVRCRSFSQYFYSIWLAIVAFSMMLVVIQIALSAIIAIGLPMNGSFPVPSSGREELFEFLSITYSSVFTAILGSSLYMAAGLSFVGITILTSHHFFHRKFVIGTVMLAYVLMVASVHVPAISELPIITMNRYVILHHNFVIHNGVLASVASMLVLTAVQVCAIQLFWHRKLILSLKWKISGLFSYYAQAIWTNKANIWLSVVVIVLVIWKASNGYAQSMQDYAVIFFWGQEIGRFHLITLLEQLIYYGAPLYVLAVTLEHMSSTDQLFVYVRSKRKRNWFLAFISNGLLYQLIYVMITIILLLIMGLLFGKTWTESAAHIELGLWASLFGAKVLELSIMFLLFFLLFIWLRNVTAAYLIVMATHAVNICSVSWLAYNPAGLVSFARLQILAESTGIPVHIATWILIGSFTFLVIINGYSYKQFFERRRFNDVKYN